MPAIRSRLTLTRIQPVLKGRDAFFRLLTYAHWLLRLFLLCAWITSRRGVDLPLSSIWHYACLAFSHLSGVECLSWRVGVSSSIRSSFHEWLNSEWVKRETYLLRSAPNYNIFFNYNFYDFLWQCLWHFLLKKKWKASLSINFLFLEGIAICNYLILTLWLTELIIELHYSPLCRYRLHLSLDEDRHFF